MPFQSGTVGRCRYSVTTGPLHDDDTAAFVAHISAFAQCVGDGWSIIDVVADISMPTSAQRRAVADAVAGLPNQRAIAGHAVVSDSAIARGVLSAVNWFVRDRPFPERVFAHPSEALSWLRKSCGAELDDDAVLLALARAGWR